MIMCFKTRGLYVCGKCPECLQKRRNDWSLRLIQESRITTCFSALLTYDPSEIPISTDGMSLKKRDIQLFVKRLRHAFPENKIKYFIAGEYSPEKFRPHYHCLFFGFPRDLSQNQVKKILEKAWGLGFVGSRSNWLKSEAQINYATNYIINLYDWRADDRREKPFNLISKGLALKFNDVFFVDFNRKHSIFDYGWRWNGVNYTHVVPFHYDSEQQLFVFDDEDFYKKAAYVQLQQEQFDRKSRSTRLGPVKRFPMPRCWREQLFTPEERETINLIQVIKHYQDLKRYNEMYEEYDKTADMPMWQQIKKHIWEQRKKSKKDKLLSSPDVYFL